MASDMRVRRVVAVSCVVCAVAVTAVALDASGHRSGARYFFWPSFVAVPVILACVGLMAWRNRNRA
jgi:uncharacterized membrane protein YdcZ (DUF606 family)